MIDDDLRRLLDNLPSADLFSFLPNPQSTVYCGFGVLAEKTPRHLSTLEIDQLKSQGNWAEDWQTILVSPDFIPDFIHHNIFSGSNYLERLDGSRLELPNGNYLLSGIFNSSLQNAEIAATSAIHRCDSIANTLICSQAICQGSTFSHDGKKSSFGNGINIKAGIETGGRELQIFVDLSLELAEFLLRHPGNKKIQENLKIWLNKYLINIEKNYTIVGPYSLVSDSSRIINSYLGAASQVQGSNLIENSCLAGNTQDPCFVTQNSIVRNSILQEGVHVEFGSIIESSMMFEHSEANQHGKVVESLVGPNSGISKGETTASFLGPFVGFHHQSLLIAAFWPQGRGNIAYGANVGSNHTSRVPDQEFWPGEGMFFGLGCTVKYPSNFSKAPYTILAAGVTTLPQRVEYPFSLINEPIAYYLEVPPGYNNLIPAWGLSENLYSLYRNEGKYKARNKAKRNTFDLNLFRDDILEMMKQAIKKLESPRERKTVYLPSDINGIGKNMLTDENRLKALEAYQFFITLSQYRKEARLVQALERSAKLDEIKTNDRQKYHKNLTALSKMLPLLVQKVELSRDRDYERGKTIMDDYALTHYSTDKDPFVLQTRNEINDELEQLFKSLRVLES